MIYKGVNGVWFSKMKGITRQLSEELTYLYIPDEKLVWNNHVEAKMKRTFMLLGYASCSWVCLDMGTEVSCSNDTPYAPVVCWVKVRKKRFHCKLATL